MRHFLIPFAAILAACQSPAEPGDGARSAGRGGERSWGVSGFDSVALAGSHEVIVATGGAHAVRASGDPADLDRLEIEVRDGTLHIGQQKSIGWRWNDKVTVHVSMPAIAAASIGGSGEMKVGRAAGDAFAASVGGSGDLSIDDIEAGSASFAVAGSGSIGAAGGSARKVGISIQGSGDVDIAGLAAETAEVEIMGSGDVRARVLEAASVSLMGSGDVFIEGGAKCDVSRMGSGDVHCG
ncbi:MAG: head GIN domain-containing protein [Sphingomonadaceae bacterium]